MPHNNIMRTTVDLADHLLMQAKHYAARQHKSLAEVIEDGLRRFLAQELAKAPPQPTALPLIKDARPVPGVDLNDTSELLEL